MEICLILLCIVVIALSAYLMMIQSQMRRIRKLLEKRLRESTQELITFNMVNKEFTRLGKSINACLQAEETLRLKSMQEEKGFKELIANISHDLRTPLTAVKGYLQLLEKSKLTDKQARDLSIAMKHTNELGERIEHFFEYAYIVNYELEPKLERLNLVSMVTECLIASITEIESRNLSLHYEERAPIYIKADQDMVTRILQNLIRNSVRYSAGVITVNVWEEDGQQKISVTNPVQDASALQVDRLFDRFYTGDPARRTSNGLGLSIVSLLVQKLNASVEATLEKNDLTITVTFSNGSSNISA